MNKLLANYFQALFAQIKGKILTIQNSHDLALQRPGLYCNLFENLDREYKSRISLQIFSLLKMREVPYFADPTLFLDSLASPEPTGL